VNLAVKEMLKLIYMCYICFLRMRGLEMKKFLHKVLLAGCGGAILVACSSENVDEQMNSLDATGTSVNEQLAADVTTEELLGTWELASMTSEGVPVNFDGDSIESIDILSETSCFDNMYFTFKSGGVVETTQARLYFDETGDFTCSEKNYAAAYGVTGNVLEVTFSVKGMGYTENRVISIDSDGTNDFLKMSLTGAETDAAVYVEDGRENTVAADIVKINFVYIRK